MFCFVILHYMVLEETVAFVENILRHLDGQKEIIIVDNNSSNGSGEQLRKRYQHVGNVTVLINSENLGFAKGNNIGYLYAKKNFNPKFIAVANNDIELPQKDFINRVNKIYEEEKFAVLGPEIFSTYEKVYQSPKALSSLTYEQIKHERENYKKKVKSRFLVPMKAILKKYELVKRLKQLKKKSSSKIDPKRKYLNPIIHGSFVIFSDIFIKQRDVAFFEGTYMYYETEILDYHCQRDGLKVIYDPSVKVLHHHSASTSSTFGNELKKVRFMNKCIYDSLTVFMAEMEKNQFDNDNF